MRLALALSVALVLPAAAPAWETRESDAPLGADALAAALVGRTIEFHDDGRARFYRDGRYSYTYAGGGTAYGYYELGADGTVCILFVHGPERCDLYVRDRAERLVLITEDGLRFPVRP